jgi:hypothetical protein
MADTLYQNTTNTAAAKHTVPAKENRPLPYKPTTATGAT